MTDRFVYAHIKRLPLFQRLTEAQIGPITRAFQVMRFEPGEIVFAQGQPSRGMYYFVSGGGVLAQSDANGVQHQIGYVGENQFLNEVALFKPTTESATLRVVQPAVVLALTRERLLNVVTHHPDIKAALGLHTEAQTPHLKQDPVFKGQRENETVLLLTRRHWWAFGGKAVFPVILMALMLAAVVLARTPLVTLGMGGLALIFPGLLTIYLYFEWRNDSLIITDQRVIKIEQVILTFKTSVVEVPLASINEVGAEIPATDIFARLFHYGNLELRTPGRSGNIVMHMIPSPERIKDIIFQNRSQQQEIQQQQQRQHIRAELDRLLSGETEETMPTAKPRETSSVTTGQTGFSLARMKFTLPNGATVYRKHYTIWLGHVLPPLLVLFAAFVLVTLRLSSADFQNLPLLLPFGLILLGGFWLYWADWDWRNDTYTISDQTISLVHKRPLWLQNEMDEILLNRVDNVTWHKTGILQNLLNYGDVRLSLLGSDEAGVKIFGSVPNPNEVQEEISRRRERAKMAQFEAEDRRQREAFGEYLSVYHEISNRDRGGIQGTRPYASQTAHPDDAPEPGPPQDRSRPPNIPRKRRE